MTAVRVGASPAINVTFSQAAKSEVRYIHYTRHSRILGRVREPHGRANYIGHLDGKCQIGEAPMKI